MSTRDFDRRLAIAKAERNGSVIPPVFHTVAADTRIAYIGSMEEHHGLATVRACYRHPVDGSTRYAIILDTGHVLTNVSPDSIRILMPVLL